MSYFQPACIKFKRAVVMESASASNVYGETSIKRCVYIIHRQAVWWHYTGSDKFFRLEHLNK